MCYTLIHTHFEMSSKMKLYIFGLMLAERKSCAPKIKEKNIHFIHIANILEHR